VAARGGAGLGRRRPGGRPAQGRCAARGRLGSGGARPVGSGGAGDAGERWRGGQRGGGQRAAARRGAVHNESYRHFRRPEAAKNKPFAAENRQFSAAKGLFSAASGHQKKSAENKAIFSAARAWPPKIAYFSAAGSLAAENNY
jgi:hypothetical protein